MQGIESKRGLAAMPVIVILALLGGALGYVYAAGIAPEIALAVFSAAVLGLLGAVATKSNAPVEIPEPPAPAGPIDAEGLATAFQASLESVTTDFQSTASTLSQELSTASANISDSLTGAAGAFHIDTAGITNSLTSATSGMSASLGEASSNMGTNLKSLFDAHTAELQSTLASHSSAINDSLSSLDGQADKINDALNSQIAQISSELGSRLDNIQQLAGDIDSVLKSTEATNAALQAMNSSENFRATMDAIKDQMKQSVAALQEATKPRTFTFVDNFEGEQG